MGSPRLRNFELPPGMLARRRQSGTYYYLCQPSQKGRRAEVALGSDLQLALVRYAELAKPTTAAVAVPKNAVGGMLIRSRKRAVQLGLEHNLTTEFLAAQMQSSGGKCSVSGIPFSGCRYPGQRVRPWMPSIDRIDSRRGYTEDNVRLVCAAVNLAINQFGEAIFFRIAASTARFQRQIAE